MFNCFLGRAAGWDAHVRDAELSGAADYKCRSAVGGRPSHGVPAGLREAGHESLAILRAGVRRYLPR